MPICPAGISPDAVTDLVHGSTVATNAILERKGAHVAFITTKGFRDILFLQRHDRRNRDHGRAGPDAVASGPQRLTGDQHRTPLDAAGLCPRRRQL